MKGSRAAGTPPTWATTAHQSKGHLDDFVAFITAVLRKGWEVHDPEVGMDGLLVCPHN